MSKELLDLLTENNYRLEFHEAQQNFHLDNYTHDPNTFGWFTVFEKCNDLEFQIFEAYVNRIKKVKLTKEYILKCKKELATFKEQLNLYDIDFTKKL